MPYCGSNFAQTSAFLAKIDVPAIIFRLTTKHRQSCQTNLVKDFINGWNNVSSLFEANTENYLKIVFQQSNMSSSQNHETVDDELTVSHTSATIFESIFTASGRKPQLATSEDSLEIEIGKFKSLKEEAQKDPTIFWKNNEHRFPALSRIARGLLSTPVSSSAVERLFSTCGLLLSNKRRNLHPKHLKQLVFLKCAKKSKELFRDEDLSDLNVSPEEIVLSDDEN